METQVLRKWRKRTLKNFMDILVMKILREEGAKSGYDFISSFHERFGVFMSSGTVYSRLYSLERDGLIKGIRKGRHRVFELTEKGKKTIDFVLKSRQINPQLLSKITKLIFSEQLLLKENLTPKEKVKQDFKITTWLLLSKEHHEVLKKIQLLEAALISLLRDFSLGISEKELKLNKERLKVTKDFLKLYRCGVMQHFKIEESTLFPVLRGVKSDKLYGRKIIEEFMLEHKAINSKYFKLKNIVKSAKNPLKILLELFKALSTHAKKEERLLPPLLRALDEKELRMIDEKAANLGYRV